MSQKTVLYPGGFYCRESPRSKYSLINSIVKAVRKDGHIFIIHWGPKGNYKSNNLLAIHHDVLKKLFPNKSSKEIFEHILNSIVFDIPQYDSAINRLKPSKWAIKAKVGFPRVVIIDWDDIGMYFSKYRELTQEVKEFLYEFHGCREDVACIQGSSPLAQDAHKGIRGCYNYEVIWNKRYGLVEKYVSRYSKKAGEGTIKKYATQKIRCKFIPKDYFMRYKLMKIQAKDRIRIKRQERYTKTIINRIVDDLLVQDLQVLAIIKKAIGKKGSETTKMIHKQFKKEFGHIEPYKKYLSNIYSRLDGLGIINYTIKGKRSEISMTDKGNETLKKAMDKHESVRNIIGKDTSKSTM
jgi:hypothetical protein